MRRTGAAGRQLLLHGAFRSLGVFNVEQNTSNQESFLRRHKSICGEVSQLTTAVRISMYFLAKGTVIRPALKAIPSIYSYYEAPRERIILKYGRHCLEEL